MKNKNKGIYATSLEANSVIRKTAKANMDSYMPCSIFTNKFFKKGDTYHREGHKYTDILVNVKFNDSLFEMINGKRKVILNAKELREKFYIEGFDFNDRHYVRLTRGAGKARVGECLFVADTHVDRAMEVLNFGLPVEYGDKVDLASWEAYRSLIMSESIGEFKVNNDEMIICADVEGAVIKEEYLVTKQDGEILKTTKEYREVQNTVTDGYAIGDYELFVRSGWSDKSMLLLRNYFYKGTVWNCNLQKWFKDNNITKIKDIFGVEHDTKNVKFISFKTSWKFSKFDYLFKDELEAWRYWLENKNPSFGVVKYSKEGNSHHSSYQHINSLPFLKDEIELLLKPTTDKIEEMKAEPKILAQVMSGSNNMIGSLLEQNEDFAYTPLFKETLKRKIASMKEDMLNGRIELNRNNCGYHTMICNPIEVLKTVCGIKIDKLTLSGTEIYCKKYEDGEKLTGFRSPHIFLGNVFKCINKYDEVFDEYFNFDKAVVIVNSWNFDTMSTLEGAD